MDNSSCIVSVAFREPYHSHSLFQQQAVKKMMDIDYVSFIDELPSKDGIIKGDNVVPHFQQSLYGFKPHAIQQAIDRGYKKVIWFDPCVLPTMSVQLLFDSLEAHPMLVIIGDAPIIRMANQKSKDWFGVTDGELEGVKHVGGTIYGFNFNNSKVIDTFNLWKKAEEEGIFGNQDDFHYGHWADEACMSLSMLKNGMEFYSEKDFKYINQKDHPQEYPRINP